MIPEILIQLAWILVIARCGYKAVHLMNSMRKQWLDILFYIAVVIIALAFLL